MAENGVQTPFLAAASSADELLGNKDGSTVRVPYANLAAQIRASYGPSYETQAELAADLDWPAGTLGLVWNDTTALNGNYAKSGASGTGSWTRTGVSAQAIAVAKTEAWAEANEDVEVETGQYSAKHHAIKASASASSAANDAADAALSRSQAELAAQAAGAPMFDSIANGLTGTTNGDVFLVQVGPGTQVFRNDTGSETLLGWLGEILYDDVDTLIASSETGFSAGTAIRTRLEGFGFKVAAAAASDHHLATGGGVKLYVLPRWGGYNARAFGAKGLGTGDDTTALQSFLDACKNRAGVIPFGVYPHTGLTLDPAFSYNISGEAYDNDAIGGSVLENTDTMGGHGITIDNTPFTGNYDSQIRLSSVTIKGNANSGNGVDVNQTMVFMENVWITGNGGHGMYALRCYSSAFRQVSFSDNFKSGFAANRALNAVHFDHCLFNGNAESDGFAGCSLSGGSGADRNFGVTFSSCDFTGNGNTLSAGIAYGLVLQHASSVNVIGCYAEGNYTYNLYADSTV